MVNNLSCNGEAILYNGQQITLIDIVELINQDDQGRWVKYKVVGREIAYLPTYGTYRLIENYDRYVCLNMRSTSDPGDTYYEVPSLFKRLSISRRKNEPIYGACRANFLTRKDFDEFNEFLQRNNIVGLKAQREAFETFRMNKLEGIITKMLEEKTERKLKQDNK